MSRYHCPHEKNYQSVFTPTTANRGVNIFREHIDTLISFDESETSSQQPALLSTVSCLLVGVNIVRQFVTFDFLEFM